MGGAHVFENFVLKSLKYLYKQKTRKFFEKMSVFKQECSKKYDFCVKKRKFIKKWKFFLNFE